MLALSRTARQDSWQAIAASEGLLAVAETIDNPHVASFALAAYGYAYRDADPAAAYEALRRGLMIAQKSGNRRGLLAHFLDPALTPPESRTVKLAVGPRCVAKSYFKPML